MQRMLARRVLAGVAVVAGVVTLTFLLLHAAPGDPAQLLLGPSATPQQVAAGRHTLGLDRPLLAQYGAWLVRFVRGDWGTSFATGRPVRTMIAGAWPATVRLVVLSLLLSYGLGLLVGAVQAARHRRRLDTALSVASVTLVALPGFWLGLMLVTVFTYLLRVLPAYGAVGYDADYLGGWG
ncbi:MAG TPA: ABC transporter permease, partial [Gemmatimonadales bacterium]